MYLKSLFTILILGVGINARAILPSEAVFHNESSDTMRINTLLNKVIDEQDPLKRVAQLGKEFLETPYVAGTLEGDTERLIINLDEMDCTTFVETVLTLAYTAGERRNSWRDYVHNLEKIRYRNGSMTDYASRLHYFSDWVVDNTHRGTIKEYTTRMPDNDWVIKTLDFMSRNRDLYPALSDSTQYERIKGCEIGYRSHRFPYIKAVRLGNKAFISALKDGDVVALTTKKPGLDVTHMGIIIKQEDVPHLMHASSKAGKVVIDELPLTDYIKRSGATGIRIIRLNE